jgi:Tfp pilus assembly protein PilO
LKLSFDREHAPTTVGLLLSILIVVVAIVIKLMPMPVDTSGKQALKDYRSSALNEETDEKNSKAILAQISNQIWGGPAGQIGPSALTLVTKIAGNHNIQLESFRPQRAIDSGDVTQYGYLINVSGPYQDVMAFEKDIEQPSTRLAVETIQIGSTDETTDNVAGTIGVEAYALTPTTTTVSTTKTTITAKPATKGGTVGKA